MIGHSTGKVDFSQQAAKSSGVVLEPKICEKCTAGFYRARPERAGQGERFCAKCRTRAETHAAERQPASAAKAVRLR